MNNRPHNIRSGQPGVGRRRFALLLAAGAMVAACAESPPVLELANLREPAMTQPAVPPVHEPHEAHEAPSPPVPFESRTSETTPEGCTLEKFTVHSPAMNRDIKVGVMLPPGYAADASARLPVLYALHGSRAPYTAFLDMNPLRTFVKTHPMLIVTFDGDPVGWYIDSPYKKGNQFATFFFADLVPFIDAHYRTRADGKSRAVTGFSMGGYGAVNYMLMHPEMFSSISSLSGAFDSFGERNNYAPYHANLLGPYPENMELYLQWGVYNRFLERIEKGTPLPPIYLHCGADDWLVNENRDLASFLMSENRRLNGLKRPPITFEYKESPGIHSWPFWRDASLGVAEFHWYYFTHANAEPQAAAAKPAPAKP